MNPFRQAHREELRIYRELEPQLYKQGLDGKEVNRQIHALLDGTLPPIPQRTLKQCYKDLIFDRFGLTKLKELVLPGRRNNG